MTDLATEVIRECDTFKIIKNTKGFNWEIKLIQKKDQTDEEWFARMDKLNKIAEQKYGSELEI